MCCFTVVTPLGLIARMFAPKIRVSRTTIFARHLAGTHRQALAYGMNLVTPSEIAMVLPLPVAPGAGEDAVTFVDLSAHPRMFDELGWLFEMGVSRAKKGGLSLGFARKQLVVHDIGSFVASYVPSRAEFDRLDPRFRLPEVLFDAVPHYHDYGFAVFQLKPGKVTVHPMGLTFPTRDRERLFFPTVHVHDGRFRSRAKFDHALYYQLPRATEFGQPFIEGTPDYEIASYQGARTSYADMVDPSVPILQRRLRGRRANEDTWVA